MNASPGLPSNRTDVRPTMSRRRLYSEVLIVLALSLGQSAVYSIVSLVNAATRATPLASQSTTINRSLSPRPTFDLIYQVLAIGFDLVPVVLVMFLLWRSTRPHLGALGVDAPPRWTDARLGVILAAAIGIPGLGLYFLGRAVGLSVSVIPTDLGAYWWTVPVLLLSAVRAGVTEEVIVVGYLFARLRELGWKEWPIILSTAVLRGSYHLYQGYPAFAGNLVMGIVFGWLYSRSGRLLPLVIAHVLLDTAVFIGYPWAAATFPAFFS